MEHHNLERRLTFIRKISIFVKTVMKPTYTMSNKESLQTISERTGYSVSTVSRVLSGKGEQYRIGKQAIETITREARECNYTPDLIAKGLRTKKTSTIGLTVPSIDNPFFSNLASIITNNLKNHGYNILLADSMEAEQMETDALNSFLSRKVDGIIAVPVGSSPDLLERISKIVPVVLIDRYFPDTTLPYVCTDNYYGGLAATRHLIYKGYRNLLAIQGVQTSMPNKERVRGFKDAVRDSGIEEIRFTVTGNAFSSENGYESTIRVLESGNPPDAIFAFSTTIMLGALTAIREKGLRIPDDIGIISFDNNRFLDYLDPPITRIEQPAVQIGQLATDMLVRMIGNFQTEDNTEGKIFIRPFLVEGRSC